MRRAAGAGGTAAGRYALHVPANDAAPLASAKPRPMKPPPSASSATNAPSTRAQPPARTGTTSAGFALSSGASPGGQVMAWSRTSTAPSRLRSIVMSASAVDDTSAGTQAFASLRMTRTSAPLPTTLCVAGSTLLISTRSSSGDSCESMIRKMEA